MRKQHEEQQASLSDAGNVAAPKRPVSELDIENSWLCKELASAKLDIEILLCLGQRRHGELLQDSEGRADNQAHYEMRAHTRLDIVDWIEGYYNRQRLHSSIGYRVSVQAEETLLAA